jgi:hypothetical protein
MSYTILNARYVNAENTAAIISTAEAGDVLVSQADTPELWAQLGEIAAFDPAPVVVSAVTRFQAIAALQMAGYLPQVEAMMADPATPVLARLAWDNALEFKRTSPTVLSMGAALGLDDAALDALFLAAAGIEA